jgi:sialic acid synthase SpsE
MKSIKIWDYTIDDDHPPHFVAELGICHGGSLEVALDLTKAAIEAGAHFVKTETFQRHDMVFDPSAKITHTIHDKQYTESLAEHMEKYELSYEEHHQIKKFCDELNVPFLSTAHDFKAVDFLCDIGAAGVKIASPDIIHFPLISYVAQKNLPIFLDTGGAFQYEVEMAVKAVRDRGGKDIIVNHCPAGHPAPASRHDLRIIPRLKEILSVPTGIADHFEGYEMLYAAAVIGANILEKPISMDRSAHEPERSWSVSISDLPAVISKTEMMYKALGNPERHLTEEGKKYRNRNRMACAAGMDLNQGDELNLENITFGRPRKGIGVEYWDIVSGKKLRRSKKKHDFIQWEDLD